MCICAIEKLKITIRSKTEEDSGDSIYCAALAYLMQLQCILQVKMITSHCCKIMILFFLILKKIALRSTYSDQPTRHNSYISSNLFSEASVLVFFGLDSGF